MVFAASWTRGDVLGLISIVVSAVGFAVAIWQIWRTADAAEATRKALVASNRTQFLFLLPQFRQLEIELELAIQSDERSIAARALSSYAHLANEVVALIQELGIAEASAVADIQAAARSATEAKNDIYAHKGRRLSTISADILVRMGGVTDHIARLRTAQTQLLNQGAT